MGEVERYLEIDRIHPMEPAEYERRRQERIKELAARIALEMTKPPKPKREPRQCVICGRLYLPFLVAKQVTCSRKECQRRYARDSMRKLRESRRMDEAA